MVKEPDSAEVARELPIDESDLQRALERDQFFLVYQPTIDLQTNAFAGVEALIRWRHLDRTVVNPEDFITELEATGHIIQVGRWALTTACQQGAIWHAKGYRFPVSVNISVKQLQLPSFVDDVEQALTSSQFDPALLVLEFSQKSLQSDVAVSARQLEALKAFGLGIAVDDFAPGHSPLANLEEFPVDIVKLDREFIGAIAKSSEASALVHTLVLLAKSLNVKIIASGVENAEQRRRLQSEEVDIGQGFLFSRPHEVDEIDRFLEDFAIFSGKPL